MMNSFVKDNKLVVYIERSYGVLGMCACLLGLLGYESYFFLNKAIAAGRMDLWSIATWFFTLVMLVLLWQTEETAYFDKNKSVIKLEKRYVPCQPPKASVSCSSSLPLSFIKVYVWPLEECDDVNVELEPTDPNFQRLVLSFESGRRYPLTDNFFMTKGSVFGKNGAGVMETKKAIRMYLKEGKKE